MCYYYYAIIFDFDGIDISDYIKQKNKSNAIQNT